MIAPRTFAALTLGCSLAFAACGDSGTAPGQAADGEPCEDGSACESKLCFIATAGEPGECRAAPAACNGDLSCSDDACFADLVSECPGGNYGCAGFNGLYTVDCGEAQTLGGADGAGGAAAGVGGSSG